MQKVFCLIQNIFPWFIFFYHKLKNDPLVFPNKSEHMLAASLSTKIQLGKSYPEFPDLWQQILLSF